MRMRSLHVTPGWTGLPSGEDCGSTWGAGKPLARQPNFWRTGEIRRHWWPADLQPEQNCIAVEAHRPSMVWMAGRPKTLNEQSTVRMTG